MAIIMVILYLEKIEQLQDLKILNQTQLNLSYISLATVEQPKMIKIFQSLKFHLVHKVKHPKDENWIQENETL